MVAREAAGDSMTTYPTGALKVAVLLRANDDAGLAFVSPRFLSCFAMMLAKDLCDERMERWAQRPMLAYAVSEGKTKQTSTE